MNKEELTITNEDIELLKEMKNNCLKADVYNDEKRLLKANAITKFLMLQQENKELHNKIDKAIEVIHTQMKNNPSYKENLKIIENNLIKGSCKICDLKDSDVDE